MKKAFILILRLLLLDVPLRSIYAIAGDIRQERGTVMPFWLLPRGR